MLTQEEFIQAQLKAEINKLDDRMSRIEEKLDKLTDKLEKHIGFIDETYEGLKNPIAAAKRFLKR